jgi:hypothetical protein
MKKVMSIVLISLFVCFGVWAKSLEQKKIELKKIYEAGGITKSEYNKSQDFLENFDEKTKEKKSKLSFGISKKKKSKTKSVFKKNKKDKDEEKITLKKVEELGQIIKFDDTYFTDAMIKEFGPGCNNSFKCRGEKAGQFLSKTFSRSKAYGQKNPGKMIKAMAMFEVFYAQKLWQDRKHVERYKENNYKKDKSWKKKKDENKIRSLLGINKGRKSMREALGMNLETPTKEAIKKFWLLGEFLDLGTGVKNKKLAKDLKKREELLEAYRAEIGSLKKKLQNDLDEEENEKSVE